MKKDAEGQSAKDIKGDTTSSALRAKKMYPISDTDHNRPSDIVWDKNDSYLSQDAGDLQNAEHEHSATHLPSGIKEKEGVWDFHHGCSSLGDASSNRGGKASENVTSSSSRKKKSIESSTIGLKSRKKPVVLNKRGVENEWNESGSDNDEDEEAEEDDGDEDNAALDLSIDRDDNKGEPL